MNKLHIVHKMMVDRSKSYVGLLSLTKTILTVVIISGHMRKSLTPSILPSTTIIPQKTSFQSSPGTKKTLKKSLSQIKC